MKESVVTDYQITIVIIIIIVIIFLVSIFEPLFVCWFHMWFLLWGIILLYVCVIFGFFVLVVLFQVSSMWLRPILSVLASHQDTQQKAELCSHQLVQENILPMSLAEDVLYVLRIVLEYFGVPPDVVCAQTHLCHSFVLQYSNSWGIHGLLESVNC